jgi:predicted RNase H-like nuclease (RuvC/YqgF family)
VVLAAVALYGGVAGLFGNSGSTTVQAQSDVFLSRRIDSIEQRFYQIESRLNRMEMQTRTAVSTPRLADNRDNEIALLRSQVDSLRTRLGEVECGLLRLDERTLPASQRRGATVTDPCRQNWGTSIRLSVRPGQ